MSTKFERIEDMSYEFSLLCDEDGECSSFLAIKAIREHGHDKADFLAEGHSLTDGEAVLSWLGY